jgi:hypothetical protein
MDAKEKFYTDKENAKDNRLNAQHTVQPYKSLKTITKGERHMMQDTHPHPL